MLNTKNRKYYLKENFKRKNIRLNNKCSFFAFLISIIWFLSSILIHSLIVWFFCDLPQDLLLSNERIRLNKRRFIVLVNLLLNAIFHLNPLFSKKKCPRMKENKKSNINLITFLCTHTGKTVKRSYDDRDKREKTC